MRLDMDNKNIWQIGSGDSSRDYSDVFLDFGVALVGPGNPGEEGKPAAERYYKDNPGVKNWGKVLRQVKKGNWLVLRSGQRIIRAVGKVASDYEYNELFGDTDGWDLQHLVPVDWYRPKNGKDITFDSSVLVRTTLTGCSNKTVVDRIRAEEFERRLPTRNYKELKVPKKLDISDISQALIDYGVRIQDAENIGATIERIIKLTKWYYYKDHGVLEHEIRTFMVVPLLISLGWSEQKIKIEYNKIDVAIFSKSFVGDYKAHPHIIIETKRFSDGLSFTEGQAKQYSKDYPGCGMLITTNGFRYKIFEKKGDDFEWTAYLNMFNLREHHSLYPEISGAGRALLKMSNFA